jgi:5-methylcytosine-specific restriction endonuclease McrA
MRRKEFTGKIRAAAFLRCGGKCENCKAQLKLGEGEYDHIIPYALSEDSSIENCQVLCVPCHRGVGAKTAQDQKTISKAKRNNQKHLGITRPKQTIKSAPFAKSKKPDRGAPNKGMPPLPRPQLYREESP